MMAAEWFYSSFGLNPIRRREGTDSLLEGFRGDTVKLRKIAVQHHFLPSDQKDPPFNCLSGKEWLFWLWCPLGHTGAEMPAR